MNKFLVILLLATVGLAAACGDAGTAPTTENNTETTEANKSDETDKTEDTKDDGEKKMADDQNVVENASASKDHTTLVTAVKAAGLAETLSGKGPNPMDKRRQHGAGARTRRSR